MFSIGSQTSSDSFLHIGADTSLIFAPVAVLPVKLISCTSACRVSASPAGKPRPNTMLTTPGGTPAFTNTSHSLNAVSDVISLGLQTTVLPWRMAGAI